MKVVIVRSCLFVLTFLFCVFLNFAVANAWVIVQEQDNVAEAGTFSAIEEVSQANPLPKASPESKGVSTGALVRLGELVTGFVESEEIVGAELLVIKNRRTVMHDVFGLDAPKSGQPLDKNTIFSIRSMTKPLAGAMAQILIDEGALKLSDPVSKYLESFDNERSCDITIEHLLTHRSGFPMKSAGRLWSDYSSYQQIREVADYWGEYGPQLFTPGDKYHYADANVDTLGAVIEQAAGESTAQLIERRLFGPLGMSDSITLLAAGDARVSRLAGKNAGGRGRWRQFWRWQGSPYFSFPMFAKGFY